MPSHKIHIAIAQEINKELNLDNDEISLGSILPDLAQTLHHGISHFQYKRVYPYNLANPDEFMFLYGNHVDAITIGYLIHLLTDRFYNQKYFEKIYIFENGKPVRLVVDMDDNTRRCIKHHDFHEYDKYIVDTKRIIPFKSIDVVDKVKNYREIIFDKDKLRKYVLNCNEELKKEYLTYDFLYWTKEELDNIYNECIEYIINYFSKNKIK